jgi:hypothetical protein
MSRRLGQRQAQHPGFQAHDLARRIEAIAARKGCCASCQLGLARLPFRATA